MCIRDSFYPTRGHGTDGACRRLNQEGTVSREGMERIVEKALADESFRAALFADPRKACAPFDITEEEFLELMGGAMPDADESRRPSTIH